MPILPIRVNNKLIATSEEWQKRRRQQSNWETFVQILSLRTQPLNIITYRKNQTWYLEFDVEFEKIFEEGSDELKLLKNDCHLIPLITGLDERAGIGSVINEENTTFESTESNEFC